MTIHFDYKEMMKHVTQHQDYFFENQKFVAQIIEHMSAVEDGDIYADADGYDHYNPKTNIKTEVKSTNYCMPGNMFRISSLKSKIGKCDIIKIIEYSISYNNRRVFKVPSKVFFKRGHFYGDYSEFRWSWTYNTEDKVQQNNTALLLEYEV